MPLDTNNYWEQLERLEKLIRASELKAGVIFSFHSLILGLFADRLGNFQHVLTENYWFIGCAVLWILTALLSIYYCFKCFQPNLQLKYKSNVFFFKDAAHEYGNVEDYAKKLKQVCNSEKEIEDHLSEQIHAESVIIDRKFINVRKAIQFFVISFVFIVCMLTVWIIDGVAYS